MCPKQLWEELPIRKGESQLRINKHTAIVAHCYSTEGPDAYGHPG